MKSFINHHRYTKMGRRVAPLLLLLCLLAPPRAAAQEYSLEQLQQMAVQHSRSLQNARLSIQSAQADHTIARTNYYPQLSASAIGFRGFDDLMQSSMAVPGLGAMDIAMMKKGFVGSLMAVQPIYQGGQITTGNKLAALQQEVNQLQLQMGVKETELQVAQYFWQLISLQAAVTTLDSVDVQLDEVFRLTEQHVKAGTTTRNDLLRVEHKRQETAAQRLRLENGISIVRLLLGQLTGIEADSCRIRPSAAFLAPSAPTTYLQSMDKAIRSREEYDLSSLNASAKALNVKMERGKLLPSLAVGAGGFYQTMDGNGNFNGLVFATISVPISAWWGGKHSIRKAKILQQQAENDRQDAYEKLSVDIQSAWNNLNEAYAQIEIARASLASAEENLRMQRIFHRAGTTTLTDLLDAVTLFTQSSCGLIDACANYQIRIAEYRRKT